MLAFRVVALHLWEVNGIAQIVISFPKTPLFGNQRFPTQVAGVNVRHNKVDYTIIRYFLS